jgi:hypothetical protein
MKKKKSGTGNPRIQFFPAGTCVTHEFEDLISALFPHKEDGKMKWHMCAFLIAVLCLSLFCGLSAQNNLAQAQGKGVAQKITVLSPIGKPPAIVLKPMAPRLSTLDGKTIYLVNDGYLGTDLLLGEMEAWFKANMPKVNVVYKVKGGGGFTAEDPVLWAEIKQKADGVVMGMGH